MGEPNPTSDDPVRRRLEAWKGKLLDLSRRNRLVSFRPTRVSTLGLVGVRPADVYARVVVDEASLGFAPERDDGAEGDADASVPLRVLPTDREPAALDKSLTTIERKASSVREEHGYNVLFLALGLLEWEDAPGQGGGTIRSPLVLVPVTLARTSIRGAHRLRPHEDDPIVNPALAQRLAADHGVELPVVPDDPASIDPAAFFAEIATALGPVPGAKVVDEVWLGLFSFTKYVMWRDLDAHADAFAERPLIRAVAAGEPPPGEAGDAPVGAALDAIHPKDVFSVMEADGSQREAIAAARAGRSVVIEGPPGTGKSQTIANLIAECLVAGKRVLFVSEKIAALEVVHDRLEQAGLADFCLQLHGATARTRRVVAELGRVLELGADGAAEDDDRATLAELARLGRERDALNAFARALGDPVEPLDATPFEAISVLLRTASVPAVDAVLPEASRWDRERYELNLERIRTLERMLDLVGSVDDHAFRGCRLTELGVERELDVKRKLTAAIEALTAAEKAAAELAAELGVEAPGTADGVRELAKAARVLAESPRPVDALLRDRSWDVDDERADATVLPERAEAILHAGRTYAASLRELAARLDPAIVEDADLDGHFEWWVQNGGKKLRLVSRSYWRVKSFLERYRKERREPDPDRELGVAVKARRARRQLERLDSAMFGPAWKGLESNWDRLERLGTFLVAFRRLLAKRRVGEAAFALAQAGFADGEKRAEAVEKSNEAALAAWGELVGLLELEGPTAPGDGDLTAIRARAAEMQERLGELDAWVRLSKAVYDAGEPDVADFSRHVSEAGRGNFVAAFERQFHRCWLDEVGRDRTVVRDFDRAGHEERLERFAELDAAAVVGNRVRARARLAARVPDASWKASAGSELGTLQREVRKKRGHAPLRRLFKAIPRALARCKPCLMMSPLTVAQMLDPEVEPFDVVVFDEASQIAPEDAVGAIARSRQIVCVGDGRQLPPTSFFRVEAIAGGDADDDADPDAIPETDLESILDECAAALPDRRLLRWHYRSRHESLIAFSNRAFYDGRLHTFPSPDDGHGRLGIELVLVEDGVYDRGGTGRNAVEAARVAAIVFDQMKRYPDKSVGVGAFSVRQQEAIQDALEELRRADGSLEERFDAEREGWCFVKNLETIQGDERDVIVLSIGYGPDAEGKVTMNFGPLNQSGGARRLNVLVTRARERVVLVTSMKADAIDLARTDAEGPRLLRAYLDFAERGPSALSAAGPEPQPSTRTAREPSAIEDEVSDVVEAVVRDGEGIVGDFEIVRQVGLSGYRVDLALKRDERFILGVVTDGPTYQSVPTARDRDRIRPSVLEHLGWRLVRVWSPAWLRDPRRERERLEKAVRDAIAAPPPEPPPPPAPAPPPPAAEPASEPETGSKESLPPEPETTPPPEPEPDPEPEPAPEPKQEAAPEPEATPRSPEEAEAAEGVTPYARATLERMGGPDELASTSVWRIVDLLLKVVASEGPIHRREAARRLATAWELTRIGKVVIDRVDLAIQKAAAAGQLTERNGFLWPKDMPEPPIRRRGDDDPRDARLIAPEEAAAAVAIVVRKELRVGDADLADRAARLLGFTRSGKRLVELIEAGRDLLAKQGTIVRRDDSWELP